MGQSPLFRKSLQSLFVSAKQTFAEVLKDVTFQVHQSITSSPLNCLRIQKH